MGLSSKLGAPIQSGRDRPYKSGPKVHTSSDLEIFDEFRHSRPDPHLGAVPPTL